MNKIFPGERKHSLALANGFFLHSFTSQSTQKRRITRANLQNPHIFKQKYLINLHHASATPPGLSNHGRTPRECRSKRSHADRTHRGPLTHQRPWSWRLFGGSGRLSRTCWSNVCTSGKTNHRALQLLFVQWINVYVPCIHLQYYSIAYEISWKQDPLSIEKILLYWPPSLILNSSPCLLSG